MSQCVYASSLQSAGPFQTQGIYYKLYKRIENYFTHPSLSYPVIKMSQRPFPLSYQRLLLSDSETESDDLSEIFDARARLTNKRGKSTAKQSRKGKRNNKEKRNEEGCAKALKEDPGLKIYANFHLISITF